MTTALFAFLGAAAGVTQSLLLLRAARHASGVVFSFVLRLLLTAAVLFPAARSGHIAAAALAWGAGFGISCLGIRRSLQ